MVLKQPEGSGETRRVLECKTAINSDLAFAGGKKKPIYFNPNYVDLYF